MLDDANVTKIKTMSLHNDTGARWINDVAIVFEEQLVDELKDECFVTNRNNPPWVRIYYFVNMSKTETQLKSYSKYCTAS